MIFNCIFCSKKLTFKKADAACRCKDCETTYIFDSKGVIIHGFFDAKLIHKPSNKAYTVWLDFRHNKTKVTVVVDLDWEELEVLNLPGFPLTPSNVVAKLPIYITFS